MYSSDYDKLGTRSTFSPFEAVKFIYLETDIGNLERMMYIRVLHGQNFESHQKVLRCIQKSVLPP